MHWQRGTCLDTHLAEAERAVEQLTVPVPELRPRTARAMQVGRPSPKGLESLLRLFNLAQVGGVGHIKAVVGHVERHGAPGFTRVLVGVFVSGGREGCGGSGSRTRKQSTTGPLTTQLSFRPRLHFSGKDLVKDGWLNPCNVLACHPSKKGGKVGQFHVLSHTFLSVFSFFLLYLFIYFIPPFFFSLLLGHKAQAK